MRRRLPAPLAEHLKVVGYPALVAIGIGLYVLALTVANALDARQFEDHARAVTATVVGSAPNYHVLVEIVSPTGPVTALGPTVEPEAYPRGSSVEVWWDPRRPSHVRLRTEPYDAATPVTMALGLVGLGSLAIVLRWHRVKRLLRLAGSADPAFAFRGHVVEQRRWFAPARPWLVLQALDAPAGEPVAGLPLLRGQAMRTGPTDVHVRGELRAGGTAVATIDEIVVWPSGAVRPGPSLPVA